MLVRLLGEETEHHQHEDEREQQEGGHYQQLKRRNDLTTVMIGSFLFANSISSIRSFIRTRTFHSESGSDNPHSVPQLK